MRVAAVAVVAAPAEEQRELRQRRDDTGHGGGHRRREDVAVVDVHELVPEHAAQLALVEQPEDALRAAHGGVGGVAARREGVRGGRRGDVQAGHGLTGLRRELADDAVHRRRLELADRAGPHGTDRDLVRVPVAVRRHDQAEGGEQHEELRRPAAEQPADPQQDRPHHAEQRGGLQPVVVLVTHRLPLLVCTPGTRTSARRFPRILCAHVPPTPPETLVRLARWTTLAAVVALALAACAPTDDSSGSAPSASDGSLGDAQGRRPDGRDVRPRLQPVGRRQRPDDRQGLRVRGRVRRRRAARLRQGPRDVGRPTASTRSSRPAPRTSTSRSTRCRSATSARPAWTSRRRTTRPRRPS